MNRSSPWFPSHRFAFFAAVVCCGVPPALDAQRMTLLDPRAEPVVVETASIATEISGRIAVTTFDLVFRNPNPRVLEGTFEFPLLDGQSVVRFALDLNGHLREAVPVDKPRARVVFEEIARRGIDPGLIEKTAGNNYRARIFPLPAGGTRRIVIAYQEDVADGSSAPTYRLPLDFPERLNRFEFSVDVFTAGSASPKATSTLGLELPAWRDARRLDIERHDFSARGVLEVALPALDRPAVLTERHDEREYFYAELPIDGAAIARPAPQILGLLWDSSGSGSARDHEREFALLNAWFQNVRDVEVRVAELRDTTSDGGRFTVRGGDWSDLRRRLERTIYDGATSIDGLTDDPDVDEWLLFSDGLFNYGVTRGCERLPLKKPVHTVLAGPRADPSLLRALAQRHAGEFANLLTADAIVAARRLREQSLRVVAIESDPGEVGQVFPEAGTPVVAGPLVVTGLLRHPKASVRVLIGHDATDARPFVLELRSGENAGHLAARGWATAKIDALSLNHAANRDDIRRTSREFGIVTADTSLLVLETIEDYARFEITPPPELRAEWERRVRFATNTRAKERETHLDRVARAWAERVTWWETKFPSRAFSDYGKDQSNAMEPRGRPAEMRRRAAIAEPAEPPSGPVVGAIAGAVIGSNSGAGTVAGDAISENETVALSPFEVTAEEDANGYVAATTLAGNRLNTELRDIGNAITVVTPEVLRDLAASTNEDLLQYTTASEVAGLQGNFARREEASRVELDQQRAYQEELAKRRADDVRFRATKEEDAVADGLRIASTQASVTRNPAPSRSSHEGKLFDPWTGDTGCRNRFQRAARKEWYAIYLDERVDRERQPDFYVDVAEFFLEHDERALGLRVLSNLAEIALEDAPLLRVLGHRLAGAGRADLARPIFERVLEIRSEEPQSRRDLALVCAELGDAQRAIDLLWEVVATPWHDRFPDVEMIALAELNAIAARSPGKVDLDSVDPRLRRNLACGLRVVVTWDADNADVDLWIDDPSGERCIYNHARTTQGGRLSRDFTQGYGPEEFILRNPLPGPYRIRLNYYGDRRQTALSPITAQVRVTTGFGTPEQREQRHTVRLADARDTIDIATLALRD